MAGSSPLFWCSGATGSASAPGEINHKGHIVVDTLAILKRGPVMPVMVIQSVDEALQVTRALLDGGINTFEITLRTSAALDGVRELVNAFPQALICVGTVRDASQLEIGRASCRERERVWGVGEWLESKV